MVTEGPHGHLPAQLSGGEQQRGRLPAPSSRPDAALRRADRGLDSKTGVLVLDVLCRVNAEFNTTMGIITHNAAIRQIAHRVFSFRDGRIEESSTNAVRLPPSAVSW
jgi:putative ABC transport system ATP-binding protein